MDELIVFLKEQFPDGIQMFDSRNLVGDMMFTIYSQDNIVVDYCFHYEYIEIFGLTDEEFEIVNNKVNEEEVLIMDKYRELAKAFREMADLYEEIANIEENEELDEQKKEEAQEELLGKLMVKTLKVQNLNK